MSQTQTVNEDELSDSQKLYILTERTDDNGNVLVELTDWNMNDETVELEFMNPYGETKRKEYARPESDSDNYKIVRVLKSTGYGLASIDTACDEGVLVPADSENNWELLPDYKYSSIKRVENIISEIYGGENQNGSLMSNLGMAIFFPVFFAIAFLPALDGRLNEYGHGFISGVLGALLWSVVVFLLFA